MQSFLERLAAKTSATSRNRFPIVPGGYSVREVDAYVDAIEQGHPVEDDELLNRAFNTATNGYDRPDVHRYLASLAKDQTVVLFEQRQREQLQLEQYHFEQAQAA